MFGRATIRLGIGPHSSLVYGLSAVTCAKKRPPFSPLKISPSHGGAGPHLVHLVLEPTRVHNPNGMPIGSAVLAQVRTDSPYIMGPGTCAKTAEPMEMLFGMSTQTGARKHVLDRGGLHWRHLANKIGPSTYGGDVALCQITLTTCL